jgi:hypothetical protein
MWTNLVEALRRAAAELRSQPDAPLSGSSYESRAGLSEFLMRAVDQLAAGDATLVELARVFAPTGVWDDASRNRVLADEIWKLLKATPEPPAEAAALSSTLRFLGLADMTVYVEEARREMAGEGSPAWIVLLRGMPLPSSVRHWMRVRLSASPEPWGTVETRTMPLWICSVRSSSGDAWEPFEGMLMHTSVLETAPALELFHLVNGMAEHDLKQVVEDRRVIDGYFCHLTVVRKNPWRVSEVRFSLSSVSEKMRGQPAVKLVNAILKHRAKI